MPSRSGLEEWVGYSLQAAVFMALALLGSICLLRPATIVAFLQNRYRVSRLARMTLFSNQVFKPWYPILVRFGLLIWGLLMVTVLALAGSIKVSLWTVRATHSWILAKNGDRSAKARWPRKLAASRPVVAVECVAWRQPNLTW